MLKTTVIFLLFIFSCADSGNKKVTDDDTGGKTGGTSNKETKLDLAVVGDSLATGPFSDTTLDDGDTNDDCGDSPFSGYCITEAEALNHSIINEWITSMLLGKLPSIAKLDKNMKENFENPFTCAENKNKSECSFSYQHRAGFAYDKVKNAAVSGAVVGDLISQLNQVEKAGNAKTYIVQVGGNDFCAAAFKQTDYVSGMQRVIDKILGTNSAAQIIVVAIPDIVELFQNAATADRQALKITNITGTRRAAFGGRTEVEFLCQHIRDGVKVIPSAPDMRAFCPRISEHIPDQDTDKPTFFATKKNEIKAANKAIADLVSGYSNTNIKFAANVEGVEFTAADISADCVHPSRAGQEKLAKAIWAYKF